MMHARTIERQAAPSGVRTLAPSEATRAGAIAARAFLDDPLFTFAMPDRKHRLAGAEWALTANVRYGLAHGVVHTLASVEALAVWMPPEHPTMRLWPMLRAGFAAAPWRLGLRGLLRFARFSSVKENLQARIMHEQPHWYLMLIAVEPSRQHRGFGGRVLEPIFGRAEAAGQPCYLETTREANLAFFEKHGFTTAAQGEVPHGPPVWGMRRG
jgi:GNAT superfamily N-acetyltransferase